MIAPRRPLVGITVTDAPDDLAPRYIEALTIAGADHVLLRSASERPPLDTLDGIIFSGGVADIDPVLYGDNTVHPRNVPPDHGRDRMELDLFDYARRRDMPVVGICRGFQMMNVAFGGKLVQHVDGHSSKEGISGQHLLDVYPGSNLARLLGVYGPVAINSRHHQAVVPGMVGAGLRPTAMSPDGLVEVIEATRQRWMMGIQCHPERAEENDPRFASVFADFVKACGGG